MLTEKKCVKKILYQYFTEEKVLTIYYTCIFC